MVMTSHKVISHYHRFSSLKSSCQTAGCKKQAPPRQRHSSQTLVEAGFGSNTSALSTSHTLHPTLMEKLRLGTPACGHGHSPTSSGHDLDPHSAFPKLHSYYTHDTHQQDPDTSVPPDEHKKHSSFQG